MKPNKTAEMLEQISLPGWSKASARDSFALGFPVTADSVIFDLSA